MGRKIVYSLSFLVVVSLGVVFFLTLARGNKTVLSPTSQPFPSRALPTPTPLALYKNVPTRVSGTPITLTLTVHSVPSKNCADCTEVTQIRVASPSQTKNLEYVCGGVAGKCTTQQDAFGYRIELVDSTQREFVKVLVKQ